MKIFEVKPIHVKWGVGLLAAFAAICLVMCLVVSDGRVLAILLVSLGLGMFITWWLIRGMHQNMVYEVDPERLRFLRNGKVLREISRKEISTIRLSAKQVHIGVKNLGNFSLTPVEGAREIYQMLSR